MDNIESLPREKLLDLVQIYAKNWLAMDGVWFQSVERKYGMDEAMFHDGEAWRIFTVIEAKRIKHFLGLAESPGLEGLAKALEFRLYAALNKTETALENNVLTYRVTTCRVQSARQRKGMEFHPCKPVGLIEYGGFARTIDSRIVTECVSCYPDITQPDSCCVWRFTLEG